MEERRDEVPGGPGRVVKHLGGWMEGGQAPSAPGTLTFRARITREGPWMAGPHWQSFQGKLRMAGRAT